MPEGDGARLEQRVTTLERRADRVEDLVDGHDEWSHRTRLHRLETDAASAKLAREALDAYRGERARHDNTVRDWGAFALAAAVALVTVLRAAFGIG